MMNPAVSQLIDRIVDEYSIDYSPFYDSINKACLLKNREIITETVCEYSRRGNFVRIYPTKNSNKYDQYFNGSRPLNKLLYKVLYSDTLLQRSKEWKAIES